MNGMIAEILHGEKLEYRSRKQHNPEGFCPRCDRYAGDGLTAAQVCGACGWDRIRGGFPILLDQEEEQVRCFDCGRTVPFSSATLWKGNGEYACRDCWEAQPDEDGDLD